MTYVKSRMADTLVQRAQFHQFRLVEHLTPFDPVYQFSHNALARFLGFQGVPSASGGADGLIYRQLVEQATTLAFTDAFLSICVLIACVLPLVLFMKRQTAV